MKTQAALAAQAIKKELKVKFPSVKFSITSKNYSGGNHVEVSYEDGPMQSEVEAITNKYEYGHFDGMQDLYEYTNCRDDIPQTKYLFIHRKMSEAAKIYVEAEAKKWAASITEATAVPEKYQINEQGQEYLTYRAFQHYSLL